MMSTVDKVGRALFQKGLRALVPVVVFAELPKVLGLDLYAASKALTDASAYGCLLYTSDAADE